MSRRARRRGGEGAAFGASLLDMMTCGLGALLLLFILKNADSRGRQDAIAEQLAVAKRVAAVAQGRLDSAASELEVKSRVGAASPLVFGIPQFSGSLLILVDASGSMFSDRLVERALELIRGVLSNNPSLKEVAIYRFSEQVEEVAPWVSPADAFVLVDQLFEGRGPAIRSTTNLLDALGVAIAQAGTRKAVAHVLLVSDGIHNYPVKLTAEAFFEQLSEKRTFRSGGVPVHSVGLFAFRSASTVGAGHVIGSAYGCRTTVGTPLPESSGQRELAEVLRGIAGRSGGAFVGIPIPCPTS